MLQVNFQLSIGANLAILNQTIRRNAPIDNAEWYAFLSAVSDRTEDIQLLNHSFRLMEDLAGQMRGCDFEEAEYQKSELMRQLARSTLTYESLVQFTGANDRSSLIASPAPSHLSCEACGEAFLRSDRGMLKRFCSERCRKRAENRRLLQRKRESAQAIPL
jgi:hypothetical protein